MESSNAAPPTATKSSVLKWSGGFVIAGLIIAFSQQFNKSAVDEGIILVIGIAFGFLYYALKRRIKIKNETARDIIAGVVALAVGAVLVGVFTALADGTNENARVTGSTCDYVVSGVNAQCSSSISSTSGYSAEQINKYCTCVANAAADVTTMREAENVKNGGSISPDFQAKITQAFTQCKAADL